MQAPNSSQKLESKISAQNAMSKLYLILDPLYTLPDIVDGSLKQLKGQEEQYKGHQLEHKGIQQLFPLVLQGTYHHNRLLSSSQLPTRMMPELM